MKIILLISFIVVIITWLSLNVWREYSIRKENHILNSHRMYQEFKRKNDIENLKQFKKMEKVFEKYFYFKESPPVRNEGMVVLKSSFTVFKPDLGMKFAKFPSIYFHSMFAILSIFLFILNIILIKK
jgi:hypothetical protein